MDPNHPEIAYLALCFVVVLVIAVNASLWAAFRGRSNIQSIEIMRKAAKTARSPFAKEDGDLQELSRRVAELKPPEGMKNPPLPPP
jgi:uncharacterized membrane protein